jgi:hypothetical protein
MIAVAVAFAVVFEAGRRIHEHGTGVPDGVFGCIAAAAIVGISFGVWRLLAGRIEVTKPLKQEMRATRVDSREREQRRQKLADEGKKASAALREARQLRIAELEADPNPERRKYAALVMKGEQWSDDQIAYNEDREATASCPHLRPIEHAIRQAGIPTRLVTAPWKAGSTLYSKVRADCRIHVPELERRFTLSESFGYSEGYAPEHYQYDNPWAGLTCRECKSSMELVHPEWPGPHSRWFPEN